MWKTVFDTGFSVENVFHTDDSNVITVFDSNSVENNFCNLKIYFCDLQDVKLKFFRLSELENKNLFYF